jgi:response regulator NasT
LYSVLIVSQTEKSVEAFTGLLVEASYDQVVPLSTCGEARRLLMSRSFDLVLVNAPLRDESGESFARYVAQKGLSQVILVVSTEHYDQVSAACENDGVLTIAKPINKAVFWSSLKLVRAANSRLMKVHNENAMLRQKIEDIKIIDRAKYILISDMEMNEQDAHRYIEKQAMDLRLSKRAIAENIINSH